MLARDLITEAHKHCEGLRREHKRLETIQREVMEWLTGEVQAKEDDGDEQGSWKMFPIPLVQIEEDCDRDQLTKHIDHEPPPLVRLVWEAE